MEYIFFPAPSFNPIFFRRSLTKFIIEVKSFDGSVQNLRQTGTVYCKNSKLPSPFYAARVPNQPQFAKELWSNSTVNLTDPIELKASKPSAPTFAFRKYTIFSEAWVSSWTQQNPRNEFTSRASHSCEKSHLENRQPTTVFIDKRIREEKWWKRLKAT